MFSHICILIILLIHIACINRMQGVNVLHPIHCWDFSSGLLSLPTAVTSVYQLWFVMHALHLGNGPHTDTVLEWGYSVSWHTGCGCGVTAVCASSSLRQFCLGRMNKVISGHKRGKKSLLNVKDSSISQESGVSFFCCFSTFCSLS